MPETETWLVYGTDTGVGKTVVAAAIAALAASGGLEARALKPIQTGADSDDDAAEIARLSGAAAEAGWRLRHPLAPAVAARLEGSVLNPDDVVSWVRARSAGAGVAVVETAGGVAVEIAEGFDMAALGGALGFRAVLVCRPGLGTLNHTLLSVEHLRRAGVDLRGLVLSGLSSPLDLSQATNPVELERLTGLPLLGALPVIDLSAEPFAEAVATALAQVLGGRFDRTAFLGQMERAVTRLMRGAAANGVAP